MLRLRYTSHSVTGRQNGQSNGGSAMNRRTLETSALALLGLGIGANAVLGPLVLNVIRLHISPLMENQLLGGELVSLVLVAPAAILAAGLWWRSHPAAPVIALGASLYALYTGRNTSIDVRDVLVTTSTTLPGSAREIPCGSVDFLSAACAIAPASAVRVFRVFPRLAKLLETTLP